MNKQHYVATTGAFNEALNAFQRAVESGDARAIAQSRKNVEELAATQAAEYDNEVRNGIMHHYRNWMCNRTNDEAFCKNLLEAILAGVPTSAVEGATFEQAFPHLDHSRTRMGGVSYASITTERIWRLHNAMRITKLTQGV